MILDILLGDVRVGTIAQRPDRRSVFRFDDVYLTLPDRPVLGRWFEDRLKPSFEYSASGDQLPAFFQNYLPEVGSALRALVARHAGVEPIAEVQLLAALGGDLPGAIVVRAGDVNTVLSGDAEPPSPRPPIDRPLRFSLAGMQLKFSVVKDKNRFVLPVTGEGGSWIAKLPDRDFPRVPENEFSMLTWAEQLGIAVPEFKLVPVADIDGLPSELGFSEPLALVVKRFDRDGSGGRVHQEDFAQVLNVRPFRKYNDYSYATLAKIVRTICGEADYEELVRRLVFVVMSGNADAHLKNWSLVYPDTRRPRLSPAYDLVCTLAYGTRVDRQLALQLSNEGEFTRISRSRFEQLAARAGASPARTGELVSEIAARARQVWRSLRGSVPLAPEARASIEQHLDALEL
jgi:serine/threonine-protein kinase HipA